MQIQRHETEGIGGKEGRGRSVGIFIPPRISMLGSLQTWAVTRVFAHIFVH